MNALSKYMILTKPALSGTLKYLKSLDGLVGTLAIGSIVIFSLQWLFQPQLFWSIASNAALSLPDKIRAFSDGFVAVFRYVDDFTPIAFIIIGFFQAVTIGMIFSLRRGKARNTSSLAAALIGSGCVACGGSILSPVLGIFFSSISVTVTQFIGDAILALAILLTLRSWVLISAKYAKVAE